MLPVASNTYADTIFKSGVGKKGLQESRTAIMEALRILKPVPVNVPQSFNLPAEPAAPLASQKIIPTIKALRNGRAEPGQISIVLVGETHTSADDRERAETVATAVQNRDIVPDMVIRERGLTYDTRPTVSPVSESYLTQSLLYGAPHHDFGLDMLDVHQRSSVIAGYIAGSLAGGDQTTHDIILIFFGEQHSDILTELEYYIGNGSRFGIEWLQRRPRRYFMVRSQER
ncbi:hypothetical protein D3869_05915 [Azospirillum brasilense]|uniref:Uncharacterized protein n=1 Tax=Azospirillum brasilense TaxID=192 RepID=A0A4D8QYJ7_AZOBR|nr:hypothetical protein [Azospirillum brasilense]QCO14791.1 hypothetical protein D3869_05915 [Azospirillum brasilense]